MVVERHEPGAAHLDPGPVVHDSSPLEQFHRADPARQNVRCSHHKRKSNILALCSTNHWHRYAHACKCQKPWPSFPGLGDAQVRVGRINLLPASNETLETAWGMTRPKAQAIVSQRDAFYRQNQSRGNRLQTVGWFVEAGIMTTARLRKINDEITMGGSVFTAVLMGQLDSSRTATAISIEIDALGPAPRLRRAVDLPPLRYHQRIDTKSLR